MTTELFTGSGLVRPDDEPLPLPAPPPWRTFRGVVSKERTIPAADSSANTFQSTQRMRDAVNAAIVLRRPLLLTGRPGSGKSSLIESVARELRLGGVLRWNVTSRSSLADALYRYDAIGRLHAENLQSEDATDIADYLTLGPLGTALLPTATPRALLIDEIDKSDIDLPNDLLDVLERGQFEIRELERLATTPTVEIREHGGTERFPITNGMVTCNEFPFVVLTSNGEREFPAAFLRRCVRYDMPQPNHELLTRIVRAHLGDSATTEHATMIGAFVDRLASGRYATDQLMNSIYLLTTQVSDGAEVDDTERNNVVDLLMRALDASPVDG